MKSTVISIVFSCQFVTLPNNHFLLMVFISIDLVCFNTALSRIYIHTKKVAAAAAPRIVRDHHHYLPFIRHLGPFTPTISRPIWPYYQCYIYPSIINTDNILWYLQVIIDCSPIYTPKKYGLMSKLTVFSIVCQICPKTQKCRIYFSCYRT